MTFTAEQLERLLATIESGTSYYSIVAAHLESVRNAPRCVCCGATGNLKECRATEHGTYLLCPVCLATEDER